MNKYPEYDLPFESFIGGWTIPSDVCDGVVDFYNTTTELEKLPGVTAGNHIDTAVKDSTDLCIPASTVVSNEKWKKYFSTLVEVIDVDKYVEAMPNSRIGFREGHNIQHYKKGGGYKIYHSERSIMDPVQLCRHLVYMTYLNDVESGGETEFLYQKLKRTNFNLAYRLNSQRNSFKRRRKNDCYWLFTTYTKLLK